MTPEQTIALWAVISSGVVGVGVVGAVIYTTRAQLASQRQMATESRYQDRVEQVYVEVLEHVLRWQRWAATVRPDGLPDSEIPSGLPRDVIVRLRLFGSPEALFTYEAWEGSRSDWTNHILQASGSMTAQQARALRASIREGRQRFIGQCDSFLVECRRELGSLSGSWRLD